MRGVAVPYIIALILGVAVIGLVGYWFASSGGKFSEQSAKTICNNKFLQWCITTGGTLAAFITSNRECDGILSYTNCNELTGTSGSSSQSGSGSGSQNTGLQSGAECTTSVQCQSNSCSGSFCTPASNQKACCR